MSFEIKSPAFGTGDSIPAEFTCDGDDVSPALEFSGVPQGTKAFALIMDDPDAPPGTWLHWTLYDLPGTAKGLPQGLPKTPSLADGSKQGKCWGVDTYSRTGYYGPCPPPGAPHRYIFKLYALDAPTGLPPNAGPGDLRAAMKGHILDETQLIGRYAR